MILDTGVATVDGFRGDHVIVAPPYTVTEEEMTKITMVMRKAYDVEEGLADKVLLSNHKVS